MSERNPLQPIIRDDHNALRFKGNAIVRFLLDWAGPHGMNLNTLATMNFTQDDREQFAQLIGYSVCGFHELSYVSDKTAAEASAAAQKAFPNDHIVGCRDADCSIHSGVERETP